MACEDSNVAIFNINLIRRLALDLGILTRVVVSSVLDVDREAKGEDRVINSAGYFERLGPPIPSPVCVCTAVTGLRRITSR